MKLYLLKTKPGQVPLQSRLVQADSRAGALRFVAEDVWDCAPADPLDAHRLANDGIKVERAKPQQLPIAGVAT